ncbi:MAG: VCBS repeat-containing protein [Acidobacteriota bacterium]|nr:VCBS repeat-containing protein [Acidobacteriota bacterium]
MNKGNFMKYAALFFCILILSAKGLAQQTVVPIVQSNMLLGGAENGRWLAADKTAPKLKNKIEFVVIGLSDANKGKRIFGTKGEGWDVCLENPIIKLDEPETVSEADPDEAKPKIALGANAQWNSLPRLPKAIGLADKNLTKLVADLLKTKGIAKTKIVITQAFRVDLEGDGKDEIILSATYYKKGLMETQGAGDYSFTLLRKTVRGKPQNILLEGDFFTQRGDYYPPNQHEVTAIADLNGDGRMEIVLHVFYYEGSLQQIYEVKENKLLKVLEAECGV